MQLHLNVLLITNKKIKTQVITHLPSVLPIGELLKTGRCIFLVLCPFGAALYSFKYSFSWILVKHKYKWKKVHKNHPNKKHRNSRRKQNSYYCARNIIHIILRLWPLTLRIRHGCTQNLQTLIQVLEKHGKHLLCTSLYYQRNPVTPCYWTCLLFPSLP